MAEIQLKLDNVTLARGGVEILKNIRWEVRKGQRWVMLGPNGCGKTSIIEVITGYQWPNIGKVTLLDEQLGRVNLHQHRRRIGLATNGLDEHIRTHQTGLQIVLSGFFDSMGLFDTPTHQQVEQGRKMLELLRCEYLADRRYSLLSLGEQRKVLLARSLIYNPEMLILDEPCAGLDIAAREILLHTVAELTDKNHPTSLDSAVYVTHHIDEILPCFTHLLAVKAGKVFAGGPLEDTLTSKLMSDMYEIGIEVTRKNGRYHARAK